MKLERYEPVEPHEAIVEEINAEGFNPASFEANERFTAEITESGYEKIREALEMRIQELGAGEMNPGINGIQN